jgi:hypothetical protein
MEIKPLPPRKILDKAFLRQRPLRSEMEGFKTNLRHLLDKIDEIEREENQKNHVRDFLLDTYYKKQYEVNVSEDKDLVIRLGNSNKHPVGVLIEAKKPTNKTEMISEVDANRKALHELILYYFDEREQQKNTEQKQLVITNVYEWYIFDANQFDKHIYNNQKLKNLYNTYKNDKKTTAFFYTEAAKLLKQSDVSLECAYFDIRDYEKRLTSDKKADIQSLIALFKILSPQHLLKLPVANDSNALNEKFYRELLHIIGLEEHKEGSKTIIRRVEKNRQGGSLIEMAISILETENSLRKVPNLSEYGKDKEEQLFAVALQLCITWVNRLLFLKLLEAQLKAYNNGDESYTFLNIETLPDFDELYKLFHNVLAKPIAERGEAIQKKYAKVPYLNSSLFDINDVEDSTIKINSLDDNAAIIPFYSHTKLKARKKGEEGLQALEYLFAFLNAYDFASETGENYQEDDNHQLINASVLGKVFEKINGYKDGSIYTPGFITMYMSRQAIRPAVVQKFNEAYGWEAEDFEHLKNLLANRKSPKDILADNALINSLHICDPAVGSGHFLVSALNELIVIKYELGILADDKGAVLGNYEIEIANDELAITNRDGEFFEYAMAKGKPAHKESQRLQETLFKEKQTLIENCLFGVDINPNSVKICRLRLWIELLKNAYYKADTNFTELETLPNIDINIKSGNSLLSRFALDADLKAAFGKKKFDLQTYKQLVDSYHKSRSREEKDELLSLIGEIKNEYSQAIYSTDPRRKKLSEIRGQLALVQNNFDLFGQKMDKAKQKQEERRLTLLLQQKEKELEEAESGALYRNAFEWRFEFPEVLNAKGDFIGFDVVIGNPPYIDIKGLDKSYVNLLFNNFKSTENRINLYSIFIELGHKILKEKANFIFIIPNSLLMNSSYKKIRELLFDEIHRVVKLPDNIFSASDVKVETILLAFKKNLFVQDIQVNLYGHDEMITKVDESSEYVLPKELLKSFTDIKLNLYLTKGIQKVISKAHNNTEPLAKVAKFSLGITPYDKYKGHTQKIIKNREFHSDECIDENYKPLISGKNIVRFFVDESPVEYIKYGDWLGAPREEEFFNLPRVIVRQIVSGNPPRIYAGYTDKSLYFTQIGFGVIPNDSISPKYLTAILNSQLITFIHKYLYLDIEKELFQKILIENCKKFPIKTAIKEQQAPLINLVDKILAAKEENPDADTKAWEAEIDQLVYQLYNLTPEEIAIIEGKTN